jgi:hypothetical protein
MRPAVRTYLLCAWANASGATPDFLEDLILWWKFDDGLGAVAADSSPGNPPGSLHPGTLVNNPTWIAGVVGPWALSFAGGSSAQQVQNTAYTNTARPLSFCFWKRKPCTGNTILAGQTSGNFIIYGRIPPNYISFFVGGREIEILDAGDLLWHHYAYAVDAAGAITVFRDGTQLTLGAGPIPGPNEYIWLSAPGAFNPSTGTAIHVADGGGLAEVNAEIDDVRIYNRSLVLSEVQAIYAQRNP